MAASRTGVGARITPLPAGTCREERLGTLARRLRLNSSRATCKRHHNSSTFTGQTPTGTRGAALEQLSITARESAHRHRLHPAHRSCPSTSSTAAPASAANPNTRPWAPVGRQNPHLTPAETDARALPRRGFIRRRCCRKYGTRLRPARLHTRWTEAGGEAKRSEERRGEAVGAKGGEIVW